MIRLFLTQAGGMSCPVIITFAQYIIGSDLAPFVPSVLSMLLRYLVTQRFYFPFTCYPAAGYIFSRSHRYLLSAWHETTFFWEKLAFRINITTDGDALVSFFSFTVRYVQFSA